MMPYYNEIEVISAKSIKDKFKGNLIFNTDTFKQKSFKMERDGYSFYCFWTAFWRQKINLASLKLKPPPPGSFLAMAIKGDPIFVYNDEGVFMFKKDLGYSTDETYNQKEERFYDKYSQEVDMYMTLPSKDILLKTRMGLKRITTINTI